MKKITAYLAGFLLVICTSGYGLAGPDEKAGQERAVSGKSENGVRVIDIKASRYKFDPDPIIVKQGEKVRLVVTSTDADHGFAIGEFKINLSVPKGETKSVEFIADKKGTFTAYCSVFCGPGHSHMHATFIVA